VNTFRKLLTTLILLFVLSLSDSVQAQDNIIDEALFWSRLGTTNILLEQALQGSAGERANTIRQMNDLWTGVDKIQLPDRTIIPVDLDWLHVAPSTTISDLQRLQWRVQAVLAYHTEQTGQDPNMFLSRLQKILQDRRFQQQKEEGASSSSGGSGGSGGLFSPFLSQLTIYALVLLAITAVAIYVWRNLQVQSAKIDLSEPDEEPTTSQAAAEKAEQLTAEQDFRAAIRYLYLASLLSLDERGIIHYDPALTNREHLQQLSKQPLLYQRMQDVVDIFDRVWYGFWPADQRLYQTFRHQIDQLRQ